MTDTRHTESTSPVDRAYSEWVDTLKWKQLSREPYDRAAFMAGYDAGIKFACAQLKDAPLPDEQRGAS